MLSSGNLRNPRVLRRLLVLIVIAGGCASRQNTRSESVHLTVSAAISLKESLDEIARLYGQQKRSIGIGYNFGASGTLERQIEQGAPVDVFISASPHEMEALAVKGLLVEESRRDLLKNEMVLVSPRAEQLLTGFSDLTHPEVHRIAMGDPEAVPAGQYAKQVLAYLGLAQQLQPKLIFTKDVRQALVYVASGDVDAGLVYKSEAMQEQRVRIVATAPRASHEPIVYAVAAVKTQHNPAAAIELVNFLLSPKAQAVFARHGFGSAAAHGALFDHPEHAAAQIRVAANRL